MRTRSRSAGRAPRSKAPPGGLHDREGRQATRACGLTRCPWRIARLGVEFGRQRRAADDVRVETRRRNPSSRSRTDSCPAQITTLSTSSRRGSERSGPKLMCRAVLVDAFVVHAGQLLHPFGFERSPVAPSRRLDQPLALRALWSAAGRYTSPRGWRRGIGVSVAPRNLLPDRPHATRPSHSLRFSVGDSSVHQELADRRSRRRPPPTNRHRLARRLAP